MIPFLCTCWGLVCTLQSQVSSFSGLVAARFFLGLCEGPLFPGLILYLSMFYRRDELQKRIAVFFTAVSLSGAFSGLLAAAIQQLDGKRGLNGWQWIFLLEGLFTILFGLSAFWLLPNSPATIRALNDSERERCLQRLREDSNDFQDHKFSFKEMFSIFRDVHVMLSLPFYLCTGALGFGLAVFSPTVSLIPPVYVLLSALRPSEWKPANRRQIVRALGYSSTITQLLTVPPYVLAFLATIVTAFVSDRYRCRGWTAFAAGILCLIGAIIVLRGRGFGVRYTGICFLVTGAFSNAPSLLTWLPNNTAGYTRRATAVATMAMMINIGGVISTWMYPTSSAPYFEQGAIFNITLTVVMEILIVLAIYWLKYQNRRKGEKAAEILRGLEHLSEEEQFRILGDHHPLYKYCY
jgi:predicted MFS family arabinose efflux permease